MAIFVDRLPIVVATDSLLTPTAVTVRGRRLVVAQMVDRWRVDTGLWRWRVQRECFMFVTGSGLLLTIYRDLADGGWYLEVIAD